MAKNKCSILNKMNNSSQMPISEILNQCVHKNRFSIMVDLLENGWNPNDADIVTAAVQEDNLILLKLLLKDMRCLIFIFLFIL